MRTTKHRVYRLLVYYLGGLYKYIAIRNERRIERRRAKGATI